MGGRSRSAIWRRGTSAAGPIHVERRGALAPDRIGEHARAVDLEQHVGEWPSQVTRRPDAGGVAKRAGSIGDAGIGCRGLLSGLAWNIAVIAAPVVIVERLRIHEVAVLPLR